MPRWSRGLLIVVALLALLIGAAYLVLLRTFPPQRLAALVAQQVSEATGRKLRIDGRLSLRLLPRIAVVATDLKLANPEGFSRPDMLQVRRAALNLRMAPLLHGDFVIEQLSLDGVDLLLETNSAGAVNWRFAERPEHAAAPATPASAQTRSPPSLQVDRLQLDGVHLAYRDDRSHGAQRAIELGSLRIDRAGNAAHLIASATLAQRAWSLKGDIGTLTALLANQADWPFDLHLQGVGAHAEAKGMLMPGVSSRALKLDLSASLDQPDALGAGATPALAKAVPLQLQTRLDWNGQTLVAEPLRLSAAGQQLSGQLSAQAGEPWQLNGRLQSQAIDFGRLLPPVLPQTSGGAGREKLFDAKPLPLTALPPLRADIDLQVAQLVLPGSPPLSQLKAALVLRPPELRADGLSFGVAGGQVRGDLALKLADGATPQLSVKLDAQDLSMPELARAAGQGDALTAGRARLSASLQMSGHSSQALAASADGQVLIEARDLRLAKGKSPFGSPLLTRLLQVIQPGPSAAPDRIDCAVVRLPFKSGVATVDRTIAIETDELAISASGDVNLRDESLRLAFHPVSKTALGINAAELASLVRLEGPLLGPRLTLDNQGAASLAVQIGAAAATGGLSVLGRKLLQSGSGDTHPCRFALTGVASKTAPLTAPAASRAPRGESLPGLLRKLFK